MTAPAPCWACHRTAQLGTPAEAAAVEPHLCPRCDHAYALSLTGGDAATHPFRGEDSPTWTAPSPEPSPAADVAELAEVPVAWLPWESGYEPELPTLEELLALATTLALARWGVTARLLTDDGLAWQVVCVDPVTGASLADHPAETRRDMHAAAQGFVDMLHELNLRDAGAPSLADAFPPLRLAPPVRCEPAVVAAQEVA